MFHRLAINLESSLLVFFWSVLLDDFDDQKIDINDKLLHTIYIKIRSIVNLSWIRDEIDTLKVIASTFIMFLLIFELIIKINQIHHTERGLSIRWLLNFWRIFSKCKPRSPCLYGSPNSKYGMKNLFFEGIFHHSCRSTHHLFRVFLPIIGH